MTYRRLMFTSAVAVVLSALAPRVSIAQTASEARSFMEATGNKLVAVVNSNASDEQKATAMENILDQRVDVDGIARFCLGQFWHMATPQQQQQYLALFRRVLLLNIVTKIGQYRGVSFTLGRVVANDQGQVVSSVIKRPSQPPTDVDWIIRNIGSSPQVTDVIAAGTSLKVTQRSDYASFIVHNNGSIQALLNALKKQLSS
jgi:phospholipid transport system substrate-binding protein